MNPILATCAQTILAVLATLPATLLVSAGQPSPGSGVSAAQATYRADRAACLRGETSQDRDTCLREAGAALQEARRGGLGTREDNFERNRLARCDHQPPEDRALCVRRMNGEGSTSGSVAGGGVFRELIVPDVPNVPNVPK
jgi:hypothetical protein